MSNRLNPRDAHPNDDLHALADAVQGLPPRQGGYIWPRPNVVLPRLLIAPMALYIEHPPPLPICAMCSVAKHGYWTEELCACACHEEAQCKSK